MHKKQESKPLLLFDGVCNLCNASVQKVIKIDPQGKIQFASLQSDLGQELLEKSELPGEDFDTVILVEGDRYYNRSDVPLRIFKTIGGGWKLLYYIGKVVPKPLRDTLYNIVAKNRYRIWGKQEFCMIPSPELKERFL